jgi:hypothetical protein
MREQDEKLILPQGMMEEEVQFDEYIKKTIKEAAEQYKKEKSDGTFLPLEERLEKQIETGEITETEADKIKEIIRTVTSGM